MLTKVEESRLRRVARRQGFFLSKSRRRDPQALDFGLYAILAEGTMYPVHAALIDRFIHSLTIEEVREYLEGDE